MVALRTFDRYTAEVDQRIRTVAEIKARACGSLIDGDEFYSVGRHAVLSAIHRYDPAHGVAFINWAHRRAHWAMQDFMRARDTIPRRARACGVKGNAIIRLDTLPANGVEQTLQAAGFGISTPPDRGTRREDLAQLKHCLDRLPTRTRHILHLRFYCNYTLREIAAQLHLTESRVQQIEAGALRQLRRIVPAALAA